MNGAWWVISDENLREALNRVENGHRAADVYGDLLADAETEQVERATITTWRGDDGALPYVWEPR
jgi:hypothetical protein